MPIKVKFGDEVLVTRKMEKKMTKAEIIGWVVGWILFLVYPIMVAVHFLFIRKGF